MKFTNANGNRTLTFECLAIGDYFHYRGGFFIKTDILDDDGDCYAIDLESGENITISSSDEVILMGIKEIVYEYV